MIFNDALHNYNCESTETERFHRNETGDWRIAVEAGATSKGELRAEMIPQKVLIAQPRIVV
jgi:hypothetical protein